MWHFTEIDNDSRIVTDPTTLTVQSHGELTQLQILVREVLQNSLDNRAGADPVRVDFRLKYLSGSEKDTLLQALLYDEILPHLEAVIKEQKGRKRSDAFPDPRQLLGKNSVLKLLYIEDFGTRGLIGPEHSRETHRFPPPHCFLGLCRNIGDSQKGTETLGGTYGLGKIVLWKHSRLRLVMFHSRLEHPYIGANGQQHWSRFFGHIRLPGHDWKNRAYKGEGFFGNRAGDVTHSMLDKEAEEMAERIGMTRRRKHQTGASILVVDFDDPDASDDQEEQAGTVERIRDSAEMYFWPAMWDGRLKVRARAEPDRPDSWRFAPIEPTKFWPFIETYLAARMNHQNANMNLKTVDVKMPKGPAPNDKEVTSRILVCTHLKSEESDSEAIHLNRTALIRGAGMVVGYQKIGRPGFGGRDFWCVVLAGKSCPDHLNLNESQRERCEQLLASAEPVTHDTWTLNSEGLKGWRGARAEIGRILEAIKRSIASATNEAIKPEGRASTLLASMFPLSEGTESDGARDMRIEVIMQPTLIESDDQELRYEFQIRVDVPARESFLEIMKPVLWRVECQYGFYGEDTRRKVVENVDLELTHIRTNGSGWQEIHERRNFYESPIGSSETSYELKGQTKSVESFLAFITKHELQVKVLKSYQPHGLA